MLDETKSPSETHSFTYDSSYRLATNTQGPRGTQSYTYTPDDRVATMAVQGGPTQSYSYYPDGSLDTITWSPVAGTFKYTYTPAGQYQEITFPNFQTRTYGYDEQGRLTQLTNALGATTLAAFAYGYDHDWASGSDTMLGQRTSMTATVPAQGLNAAQSRYFYDPLYQLVKAQYPAGVPFGGGTHEWTYDALGNRLTNKLGATTWTYTYQKNGLNPLNGQRLTSDGQNTYLYDPNGNQTRRTPGAGFATIFDYDFDNRLIDVTATDGASYAYDYQGRRISKTQAATTTYLYDGLNLVRETTGADSTDYVFGPSSDEPLAMSTRPPNPIAYFSVDGLGSVVLTSNPGGASLLSTAFDAWGVSKNETGLRFHPFTYTGREVGEGGLLFYRARFLQPGVGRFTEEDPLRFDAGPHFYRYVSGNPIGAIDPMGLTEKPGFWESLIPIWGTGKEAVHDFECGRWGWGLFNSALAVSDVFVVRSVITGITRGAWKFGSNTWRATRSWYGETRGLAKRAAGSSLVHRTE